uniref:Uncharacterized protein n=1 Tax=Candidatus Kentrum sp. FM TaxID=2126340 RepID=A0A450RX20_9GAMM|nr:MAG: hypothetical protein BECKFM1743A_GA0114220_1001115 [Candidatus Kentron sp. FM]VFK06950.1 MAG: hypothetical protein BECKFM1743B_GA0114221_100288 [Candidatus Kentron sp. FM]
MSAIFSFNSIRFLAYFSANRWRLASRLTTDSLAIYFLSNLTTTEVFNVRERQGIERQLINCNCSDPLSLEQDNSAKLRYCTPVTT